MGNIVADLAIAGFDAGSSSYDDERNVIESMGVAFAEFVDPNDGGVVEHVAIAAGLRSVAEAFGEVGELLGKPDVDLLELVLSSFVFVGLVTERVVAVFDA